MKEPKSNIFRKFLFSGLFENIYHFLILHIWMVVSIIGIGISVMLLLLALEFFFPKKVQLFNYALTDKTFTELYDNHHYHAAIFVAEEDTSYSSNKLKNTINRNMLRDCYIHVGEYSKAEKISLDVLEIDESRYKSDTAKIGLLVCKTVAARDLFRLYEKMGDRERQMEMYDVLVDYYNNPVIRHLQENLRCIGISMPAVDTEHPEAFSAEHNLKYDILCGMYYTNPDEAIDSLTEYMAEIWTLPKYSASLKLTILNRLISWHLERSELFKAHTLLLNGIEMAKCVDKVTADNPLGEFAEYCYILNDKKNARRFMNVYMRYMDKYYDDTDLEYLLAEMRCIKYSDDENGKVVDRLVHCCSGIREQISRNFAGMTQSQQEYFAEMLDEPFSYALGMMAENPENEHLVELCFENEVFKRGLLMRTDALLRQALAESEDTALLGDYEKYLEYKRELMSREEISGPGNGARKAYLNRQIEKLEKRLVAGCSDFSRENYADVDVSRIKSALDRRTGYGSLVMYVEVPSGSGTSLGAFVLNIKHGLHYRELCAPEDVEVFSNIGNPDELCRQTNTYKKLFSGIENLLDGSSYGYVIYSPTGIVHRIPLAALYTDENQTLGDKYKMKIVANPIELEGPGIFKRRKPMDISNMQIALWGGINYGGLDDRKDSLVMAVVNHYNTTQVEFGDGLYSLFRQARLEMRGKRLSKLPGSLNEVNEIEELLRKNGITSIIKYTDVFATEKSFKTKAEKANIIHISTHGFFKEDKSHEFKNAMHNSGLFFANANKAWMDHYIPESYQKGYEDGILRADEIETQNLASCELVVLSACETGLGEIRGDEGVFGLQRAFKLAGAKCIVMSLWPVPDNATKELMKRFYLSLAKGETNVDWAFNNAQKSMKSSGYPVRDWGGFVIMH